MTRKTDPLITKDEVEEIKRQIEDLAQRLLFEQNDTKTRNRFIEAASNRLSVIRLGQGIEDFRVVMDDTNNTPDVVDRNILFGQIFLQPTKTAEFIVLDFTIQPTGASFPE
mgnify:CR=1 FL=1